MPYDMDDDFPAEVFAMPEVIDELERVANEEILPRAVSLAGSAGLHDLAASLRVDSGIRPKGRSYARVVADHDDAERFEHGDSRTNRYRILGRAAGTRIWPDT